MQAVIFFWSGAGRGWYVWQFSVLSMEALGQGGTSSVWACVLRDARIGGRVVWFLNHLHEEICKLSVCDCQFWDVVSLRAEKGVRWIRTGRWRVAEQLGGVLG